MSDIEELFEAVRREDVTIWAGAGVSAYAGYPAGGQLVDRIRKSLTMEEAALIEGTSLQDVAEDFCRLKGNRDALLELLKSIYYDTKPSQTSWHERLSRIPHIKSIVTTNFDQLFEMAYAESAQVLLTAKDLTKAKAGQVKVFKVHGDVSIPNSVIITRSDYENFFRHETDHSLFWSCIKERVSTMTLAFIGYGLEDATTNVVFDGIIDALADSRKSTFFIAPQLPKHKISRLAGKGISYINATAEFFLSELEGNLKRNVVKDFDKGIVTADTFRQFLSWHKLLPDLTSTPSTFTLKAIRGVNDVIDGKFKLVLKDATHAERLQQLASGHAFGEIEIAGSDLTSAELTGQGITLIGNGDFASVGFKSVPMETTVDLIFKEGTPIINLPVKIFKSEHLFRYEIRLYSATIALEVQLRSNPISSKYFVQHDDICLRPHVEIVTYSALKRLFSNVPVTLAFKDGKKVTNTFPMQLEIVENCEWFMKYFHALDKIENHFGILFQEIDISKINEEMFWRVIRAKRAILGETWEIVWDGEMRGELEELQKDALAILTKPDPDVFEVATDLGTDEILVIHDQEINIGRRNVKVTDAYISSVEPGEGSSRLATIRSKSQRALVSYKSLDVESRG